MKRILPKGITGLLTGGILPRNDRVFRPNWLWTTWYGDFLATAGKILFPLWPTANCHVFCGATGVGKSTLLFRGLHALAAAGLYEEADLRELDKPTKTEDPSRFTLERQGLLAGIDSWIDIKGEDFSDAFLAGGGDDDSRSKKGKALEVFLNQVNTIVMVVSAQQLMDLYRRRERPQKWDHHMIAGFSRQVNDLHPTLIRAFARKGFRWHLVVNQSADVLGSSSNKLPALIEAVRYFSDKTGFHKVCRSALLCDCVSDSASFRGLKPATISVGPRGGLGITRQGVAKICDAGVALGIILGRIRHRAGDHKFIVPLR